jgi:membrane protein implicated in regulation of membrane protease activity
MLLGVIQAWLASFAPQAPTVCKTEWEGKIETVVEPGKIWRVGHNATFWFARSDSSADFRPGDWVKVIDRQGLTLFIEPLEDSEQ